MNKKEIIRIQQFKIWYRNYKWYENFNNFKL